jgi:hypothetical protein
LHAFTQLALSPQLSATQVSTLVQAGPWTHAAYCVQHRLAAH